MQKLTNNHDDNRRARPRNKYRGAGAQPPTTRKLHAEI
jgi:hypothetical protein